MKTVHVAAAIIRHEGRILATQRGYGDFKDWWEFPGGKVEPGETAQDALVREIREELDALIGITRHVIDVEYDYPTFHLNMSCWLCTLESGITLVEHEAARWLDAASVDTVSWLPADTGVIDAIKAQKIL
jgi:8-oxo-dGTP diphosphatase